MKQRVDFVVTAAVDLDKVPEATLGIESLIEKDLKDLLSHKLKCKKSDVEIIDVEFGDPV